MIYKVTTHEFYSDGYKLASTLYMSEGEGKIPSVVLANGFACIQEMNDPQFAEGFAKKGFATLIVF